MKKNLEYQQSRVHLKGTQKSKQRGQQKASSLQRGVRSNLKQGQGLLPVIHQGANQSSNYGPGSHSLGTLQPIQESYSYGGPPARNSTTTNSQDNTLPQISAVN